MPKAMQSLYISVGNIRETLHAGKWQWKKLVLFRCQPFWGSPYFLLALMFSFC